MPPYNASPGTNTPVRLALEGQINVAFGTPNNNLPTARLIISNVAATGGTATLTVQVVEGNIPAIGQLVTVKGTSLGAGALNVTNAAITGVSIDAKTGKGTITFASGATISSAADTGTAYVPPGEVLPEALANGASQAFAVQVATGENDNQKTITWSTSFGTAPAGITVALQISNVDLDAAYVTIDSSNLTTGDTRFYVGVAPRFVRFLISGISGSSPTGSVVFWL